MFFSRLRFQFLFTFGLNMRIASFLIYLCILLIGGGQYTYADSQNIVVAYSSSQNLTESQQTKILYKDQGIVIVEDTDLDIEEDHLSDKAGNENTLILNEYTLPHKWYLCFSGLPVLNNYYKSFSTSTLIFSNSSPIYIRNGVLRI